MPSRRAILDAADVLSYVRQRLRPSRRDLVGVEAEWLTYERFTSSRPRFEALHDIATSTPLPCDGAITLEPGGQIELSSRPFEDVDTACDAFERDATALFDRLELSDIRVSALGYDPRRDPQRIVRSPRYNAMESYFDSLGSAGRVMMSSTAALHINIGLGADDVECAARWRAAHILGPVLAGAFCNSAIVSGLPSGWRSARLANWFSLDPARTRPVGGGDPGGSWARYALDAPVMFVSEGPDRLIAQTERMTLEQWVTDGHPAGYPDLGDVALHLTTLFPPVRPRGWLELRMIDALPLMWSRAAIAVVHTVVTDRDVREAVLNRMQAADITWQDAYLFGSANPEIASVANTCFEMALMSLEATGATDRTLGAVADYAERFVRRRRTPADESLEAVVTGREPFASDGREAAWT